MATTTINVTKELVSTQSLVYIRPLTLVIRSTRLKPNTRMYPFFDTVDVSRYVTQVGKALGEQLVSDADGNIELSFFIPGMTFTTGTKKFLLSQNSTATHDILGSTEGYATADFGSTSIKEIYQQTETTTIEHVIPVNVDPIAQSFFTYGVSGGCFLTSIDLYFQSKDSELPVWVELRELENGTPSKKFIQLNSTLTKTASNVNISNDASIATNFKFNELIYLLPEKDYCFVVQSSSDKYNLWTSKLGELSKETGQIVFAQPYVGSMFRSENNITWTADQFEDVKFVLNKAEFDTTQSSNIKIPLSPYSIAINSAHFRTIVDTNTVYVNLAHKHELDLNSKIAVSCDVTGTYNGITGAMLTGVFSVFDIVSEYEVGFIVPSAVATSTGNIYTGGLLKDILVESGGSGYDISNPPTIEFTGAGSGAVATVVIKDGAVYDIVISAYGSGYSETTGATIVGLVGSGATLTTIIDSKFTTDTNRLYHSISPIFTKLKPQDTDISSTLQPTILGYSVGESVNIELGKLNRLNNNMVLASRFNESTNMANAPSTMLGINLSSSNKNVSPIVDIPLSNVFFDGNVINNQSSAESIGTIYNTELSPSSGTAQSRYITKKQSLVNLSTSIKLFVSAYTNVNSSFDAYIRTATSSSGTDADTAPWQLIKCDISRNKSEYSGEFLEYEMYLDGMAEFDIYMLKIVLRSTTPWDPPIITNYRAILLAA